MKQPPAASIESTMIVIARGLGSPSFAAARDHLVHDQAERSDVHLHIPLMHAGIILRKERDTHRRSPNRLGDSASK